MSNPATLSVSHDLVRELHASQQIAAAACHGPAVTAKGKLDDRSYLIANSAVTGFANAEEVAKGV